MMTSRRSLKNNLPDIFINEIDFNDIKTGERIDKGGFGEVFCASYRNTKVAVKMTARSGVFRKAYDREKHYLSLVSHENIVKFYGTTFDPKTRKYGLVLEFAECGNLYNLLHVLHPENKDYPTIEYKLCHAMNWMLQCAKGMDFLHKTKPKAIVHRDLKPQNLLLFKSFSILKICDFGVTTDLSTRMTKDIGSVPYIAPEVLDIKVDRYDQMCDVYSFAIVLWQVLSRRKPYENFDNIGPIVLGVVEGNLRPPLIRNCPPVLEKLMTKCWSRDPNKRFKMNEVVEKLENIFPFCYDDQSQLCLSVHSSSLESSLSLSFEQNEYNQESDRMQNFPSINPISGVSLSKRLLSKLFGKKPVKVLRSQSTDSVISSEQRLTVIKRSISEFIDITNEFSNEETQTETSHHPENIAISFIEEQIEENEESWLICELHNLNDLQNQ